MSMQTAIILLSLIGGIFGIAFLGALGLLVYHLGKKSTQENDNNALIFIRFGNHWRKPVKGKLQNNSSKGLLYTFQSGNKIIIPHKYKKDYYQGNRLLFAEGSDIIASNSVRHELVTDIKTELGTSEKKTLLQELLGADIGGGAVKAVKGKPSFALNIVIVVIALILGAGLTYGYIQFRDMQIQEVKTQQTQQTQQPQQQIIPAR